MHLKELSLVLAIFGILIALTSQETTNFDYEKHGQGWTGDCSKNLSQQSPIILKKPTQPSSKDSYFFSDFRSTQSTGTKFNTTFLIKPTSSSNFFGEIYTKTIDSQPVPFKANQIRIRVHSQHRIQSEDGLYDLQIQISSKELYDSSKNIKLNIGLLFEAGEEYEQDPFLAQIIKNSKDINETFQLNADLSHLLSRDQIFDFWFYKGSITYPPCSNGKINWIIPQKIFKVKSSQVDFFKNQYPVGNWRQVQPLNGNEVAYVKTSPTSEFEF